MVTTNNSGIDNNNDKNNNLDEYSNKNNIRIITQ